MIKLILIEIIKFYQKIFSPDHGWTKIFYPFGCCRFRPTCSEYAIQAINKYPIWRALLKIIWRLIRCNPFNQGGIDYP